MKKSILIFFLVLIHGPIFARPTVTSLPAPKWTKSIDQFLLHVKECEDIDPALYPKEFQNNDNKSALSIMYANEVHRDICLSMQLKESLLGSATICPGMNLDNFHLCYSEILSVLGKKQKISSGGYLYTLTILPKYYMEKTKNIKPKPRDIMHKLVDTMLTTLENFKDRKTAASYVEQKKIPITNPQDFAKLKEFDQKTSDMFVQQTLKMAIDKYKEIESLEKKMPDKTPGKTLVVWQKQLKSRLDQQKLFWQYNETAHAQAKTESPINPFASKPDVTSNNPVNDDALGSLSQSCHAGNTQSCINLGLNYQQSKDLSNADLYFMKACNQGSSKACILCLQRHQDDPRVQANINKNCGAKDQDACHGLALIELSSPGLIKQGGDRLEKLCTEDHFLSCGIVGSLFEKLGRNKDAAYYYDKSCKGGLQRYCSAHTQVINKMEREVSSQ